MSPRPTRTKDEKEAYCLRCYLLTLSKNQLLSFPIVVAKGETPDFVITGVEAFGIEVTEATDERDQREWSLAARAGLALWAQGQFGGRGANEFSGRHHERLWLQYVVDSVNRKGGLNYATERTRLLINSNSNAGGWVGSPEAFTLLEHPRFAAGKLTEVSIIKGDQLLYNVTEASRRMLQLEQ